MDSYELFPGGKIEDLESLDKALSEEQIVNMRPLPIPSSLVRESLAIITGYNIGFNRGCVNRYLSSIAHTDNLKVWSTRRGLDIISSLRYVVTDKNHQERLEQTVNTLSSALEREHF